MLNGKQIVLGVTGGIAAYKAAELERLMVKGEANVYVVMTRNAQEFIAPLTFQTLSGNPVVTDPFTLVAEQEIGHIALADLAELIVILPATANIIGKIANGIADDFLSTMVMATMSPEKRTKNTSGKAKYRRKAYRAPATPQKVAEITMATCLYLRVSYPK